tara:strand:+ start:386 stop:658 length:273 start_codon:yes stop_codon:yes gene_type:complete
MKITKRQLKRIIREEKRRLYEWGPGGPGDRGLEELPTGKRSLEETVDGHLLYLQYWMDAYSDFNDPRAEDIEELLFQLNERMMAVKENRE